MFSISCRHMKKYLTNNVSKSKSFLFSSLSTSHNFDIDRELIQKNEFEFTAIPSDRFSIKGAPNGGYLMSIAVKSALKCVDKLDPLTFTAYYINKTLEYIPIDISVQIIGKSNSTTTVTVQLSQEGLLRCHFTGHIGTLSRMKGLTKINKKAPILPPVGECIDAVGLMRKALGSDMTIANEIDYRLPKSCHFVSTTLDGKQGDIASMNGWVGFNIPRNLCMESLSFLSDAFPPPVLNFARFGWVPTLEYTVHFWNRPIIHTDSNDSDYNNYNNHLSLTDNDSIDHKKSWLRLKAETTYVQNSMCYLDNELWSADGEVLLTTSRQLARVMIPINK